MFGTYIAGMSFADGLAHIVVLQVRKRSLKLRHLAEFGMEEAGPGEQDPLWFLRPVIDRPIREKMLRKAKKVSVAIENAAVFQHSFPSDTTLSRSEAADHLAWELSQFIPGYQAAGYINDVHVLQTHHQEHVADLFVVAAPRSLVAQIQQALSGAGRTLGIADTVHFGAEYALAANYPELKTQKVALVGVMKGRVDLGIITNARLTGYHHQKILAESDVLDFLSPHVQTEAVSGIYFYGGGASAAMAGAARDHFGLAATLLDPFRVIDTTSYAVGLERYAGLEHLFAPAVGCLLRNP